ncbi:MAG TPA: hypothetical protein VG755_13910 [Nannocystaceae bacterium]|nr:hypothetical protein [Nannocystaceae bacterium]
MDPSWLERDPELLALRIELTDRGMLSEMLAPVPADRTRVESLPGDRIGFRPWALAEDGALPEDALDLAYFACSFGGDCLGTLDHDDALTPCDGTFVRDERPCFAGRGADTRYEIPTPDPNDLSTTSFFPSVVAIAGEPDVRDTDSCIDALREPPYEDLHGCMLLERSIPIGPSWVLAALLGLTPAEEIPPEVLLQAPNFNPEVDRILVQRSAGGLETVEARSGDRVSVKVGEHVRLTVDPDPRDAQQYAVSVVDGNVLRNMEGLSTDWYANVAVPTSTEMWINAPVLDWTAKEAGEVRFDVLLQDGLGGLGWGAIVFDVQ